jgi:hypothetical protein
MSGRVAVSGFEKWDAGLAANRRYGLAALLVAVCVFGLFTSFCYHFTAWSADPDTLEAVVVWRNVKDHGLGFLPSWSFTPDNWLLTIIAPESLLFQMVGAPPSLVVGLGWAIFLGDVVLTAIIGSMLGGRMLGLAVAAYLLVANEDVLGKVGFLSHPASHTSSLLWGLAALACMARWLRPGAWPWLALSTLGLGVDCVSDPWALVGFALPMALATGLLAATGRDRRRAGLGLGATLVAAVVAVTRVFGILDFLPRNPVQVADIPTFDANAAWLSRSVGVLFNPIPGLHHPADLTTVGVCLILGILVARSAWELARASSADPDSARFLLVAIILSAGLPCAAFLLSRLPLSIYVGRFVPSLVVFAPVLVFACLRRCRGRLPAWMKLGAPAFFGLIAIAGVASDPAAWRHGWRGVNLGVTPELTAFLAEKDLTYGFGSYWGTSANAVTLLSDGGVTIRPIWFNAGPGFIAGQIGQTSSRWYRASDRPPGQRRFFVAISKRDDACANPEFCVSGLKAQFGPTIAIEHFRDLTFLVWDHPLDVRTDF